MRAELLIADHFETLANGKIAALGLYADRVLILQPAPGDPLPSAERMYGHEVDLLLSLSDLPESQAGQLCILAPGQAKPVLDESVGPFNVLPGRSNNLMLRLRPLAIPGPGIFEVVLRMADEEVRCSFEIRIERPEPSPERAPPARARNRKAPRKSGLA